MVNIVGQGRRGFTLIELLVVISIIAILSAGSIGMFTNSQRRARDARRRSDLKQVQTALEQYNVANNQYPDTVLLANTFISGGTTPFDPRGGSTDIYEGYTDATLTTSAYLICADLELDPPNDTVDATWTAAQNEDDFCVRNLQ